MSKEERYKFLIANMEQQYEKYWRKYNEEPEYVVMNYDTCDFLATYKETLCQNINEKTIQMFRGTKIIHDNNLQDDYIKAVGE